MVVDASLVVSGLADDAADGRAVRGRLAAADSLHAPELIDLEALAAWRRQVQSGQLTDERCAQARKDLRDLAIERYSHLPLLEAVWSLRENLTAYDAAYVALAALLGAPLVTADRRLAGAPGLPCVVELLEVGRS